MESPPMRHRLQVSFWGIHINAKGIVAAIVAAVLLTFVAFLAK